MSAADWEALAEWLRRKVWYMLPYGAQAPVFVARAVLASDWLAADRARVRAETLAEVERRIEKRAAKYDHPNEWVARDLLQIVAREVRGMAEAGEPDA